MNKNKEGYNNTAIGEKALYNNTKGYENIAVGIQSLQNNTTGSFNTAIGANALDLNTSGRNNVAVGKLTLHLNNEGEMNTALGFSACYYVKGSHKTCLGANSGPTTHDYSTDYKVYIGDSSSTIILGGTTTSYSDRRLKYVGAENKDGLEKIKQLKVFNYTFKNDENKTPRVGIIAQDLMKVFPKAVSLNGDGFYITRTEDILFALVNAVKELDTKITALFKKESEKDIKIKALEAKNKELEIRIQKLEAKLK